jgi:hypothetical protein
VDSTTTNALRGSQGARATRLARAAAKRDGLPPPQAAPAKPKRRRPTMLVCAWCATSFEVNPVGRVPTWCSDTCRHRAWEQNRAAASGRSAIQLVERIVEVDRPAPTVHKGPATLPNGTGWDVTLVELVRQLDTGRIYQRDLAAIVRASVALNDALHRRLIRRH